MKINFKKVEVKDVGGNNSTVDVSKELGNAIYRATQDLGELDFAREIYKNGEVEVTTEQIEVVRKYMNSGGFFAFVKEGIENLLSNK